MCYGKTFVMDYEGHTLEFFSRNKQDFSLKCDIYYAFTFKPYKNHFKMPVTYN